MKNDSTGVNHPMERMSEPAAVTGGKPSRVPLAIGGLIFAAVVIVACIQHAQGEAVRAELKAVSERLAGISSLEKEVRRALGHVIIEEAPPELAVAVREAVERWLPAKGGQFVPESSEEIRSDLAFLEESMGTGLDQAFRSEVRMLSWWADAIDLHHAVGNQLDRAPSVYEWAQSLRLSTPMKAPNWAFDVVLASERKASIEIARLAVSKPFTNTDEIDDTVAILDQLGRELGSDGSAFIVEERQKLVAKGKELEDRNLGQYLEQLKAQRAKAIAAPDPDRIKLQIQASFDGQIMGVLSSLGDATPARRNEVEGLVQAWQAETRKLENLIYQREMLRYQKWALDRIKDCNDEIQKECKRFFNDSEVCVLDKMKSYLVPIDTNLLQPPIQERFNTAWTKWMDQLDEPEKMDLLWSISETPKKGLGEV